MKKVNVSLLFLLLSFFSAANLSAQEKKASATPQPTATEDEFEVPEDLSGEQVKAKPQRQQDPLKFGEDGVEKTSAEDVRIDHEVLIEELLKRLESADERTRTEAGIALRKTAKLSDVSNLAKVLKQGNNTDKQIFLIETLSFLQDPKAAEALRFEVVHGIPETQRAAVTALGKLNTNSVVPVLVRTLRKHPDDEMRKRAASALSEIATPQAKYALRTSLTYLEDFYGAKNAAFWALDKLNGTVTDDYTDAKFPRGQTLNLFYKGLKYYFYSPDKRRDSLSNKEGLKPWLLVCVHDKDLQAEDLFALCYKTAKQLQMAVIAPFFDNIRFPDYGSFNIRGQRSDKILLELIDFLGKNADLSTREFYLFGFGSGGDFAQKFTLAYPKRIAKAAYESENFVMPDPDIFFPKGLNKSSFAPDINIDMYQFLKTDQMLIISKTSPTKNQASDFFEGIQHYSKINGIRNRMSYRTIDVRYEIWNQAESFLLTDDY